MGRHTARWLPGALAAGVLGAGLLAWRHAPDAPSEPAAAFVPAPAPAAPVPKPASASTLAPPGSAVIDEPPLNVQIERLLATRRPEDAYRAYWLVADCASFNLGGDRIIFDKEEIKQHQPGALPGFRGMTDEEKRHDARLCSGMTERERQSRLDYLATAARAGVSGAAVNFAAEGPFGDPSALRTRPDDPLVREWKATASAQLTQAAEAGADMGAIQYLAGEYGTGSALTEKNPQLAYRYRVAWTLIEEEMVGPGTPLSELFAGRRQRVVDEAPDLSAEQRAAEFAAARRIADLAKARRGQAARNATPRN